MYLRKNKKSRFEMLYQDYYSDLVRFCTAIVYNRDEAQDLVQELFLELWHKKDLTHIHGEIEHYLFRAAKYKCLNRLKQLSIHDRHEESIKEALIYIHRYSDISDEKIIQKIESVIDLMPSKMKIMVQEHYQERITYRKIAERHNISVNTVKTQIKRAYSKIRSELQLPNNKETIKKITILLFFFTK
ncbi:RNA polymerase sigma-70 factor [Halosquirtibacter xylanolyticus]|uniref:RNA polymerase sigma-70 factor n=1 Tax=Halosquirtibacter xylanolyticus TaxID=3374599 RepID=UPI0037490151|nr:RNA polymerase sigma-70 factor [Prolixibacteraceae bacterium]